MYSAVGACAGSQPTAERKKVSAERKTVSAERKRRKDERTVDPVGRLIHAARSSERVSSNSPAEQTTEADSPNVVDTHHRREDEVL